MEIASDSRIASDDDDDDDGELRPDRDNVLNLV